MIWPPYELPATRSIVLHSSARSASIVHLSGGRCRRKRQPRTGPNEIIL